MFLKKNDIFEITAFGPCFASFWRLPGPFAQRSFVPSGCEAYAPRVSEELVSRNLRILKITTGNEAFKSIAHN